MTKNEFIAICLELTIIPELAFDQLVETPPEQRPDLKDAEAVKNWLDENN